MAKQPRAVLKFLFEIKLLKKKTIFFIQEKLKLKINIITSFDEQIRIP